MAAVTAYPSAYASPGLSPAANVALVANTKTPTLAGKARKAAEYFESVFLNTMFQQMFSKVADGPFSGGHAAGVWRSFLTDEYARSFAKAGGIGIADHVQRSLLAQQEVR